MPAIKRLWDKVSKRSVKTIAFAALLALMSQLAVETGAIGEPTPSVKKRKTAGKIKKAHRRKHIWELAEIKIYCFDFNKKDWVVKPYGFGGEWLKLWKATANRVHIDYAHTYESVDFKWSLPPESILKGLPFRIRLSGSAKGTKWGDMAVYPYMFMSNFLIRVASGPDILPKIRLDAPLSMKSVEIPDGMPNVTSTIPNGITIKVSGRQDHKISNEASVDLEVQLQDSARGETYLLFEVVGLSRIVYTYKETLVRGSPFHTLIATGPKCPSLSPNEFNKENTGISPRTPVCDEARNEAQKTIQNELLNQLDMNWKNLYGRPLFKTGSRGLAVAAGKLGRIPIDKTGDVLNTIKLAEGLEAHDWKESRNAVSPLDLAVLTAIFPIAGPLVLTGKNVNTASQGFNKEIFSNNIETIYKTYREDDRLFTPEGVNIFIEEYLFPYKQGRIAFNKAHRRRAYLHEYARKKGIYIGKATEWRSTDKKQNLLSSTVNFMRQDFLQRKQLEDAVEKLHKIKSVFNTQINQFKTTDMSEYLKQLMETQSERCTEIITQ
ncbi:MAG: hypothetical protein GY847_23470 [Proteobacteria bacterium]|nr:hypothetical protein [Pseudomonadota bacterium]